MEYDSTFFEFIKENRNEDINKLRLKYADKQMPFDVDFALTQIEAGYKSAHKLPSFVNNESFLFPTVVSAEQATGEILARFHSSLIPQGSKILDMTCGLGIDCCFMASKAKSIIAFDINPIIAETAKDNMKILGVSNVETVNGDSIRWLENHEDLFDVIFADPARRGETNKRTFALSDCTPDILKNLDLIKNHTNKLIVKASPMLDIKKIRNEISCVSHIWVLSVRNECKELLLEVDFNHKESEGCIVTALNFKDNSTPLPSVEFNTGDILPKDVCFAGKPEELSSQYLYIPDSSLMKTGASSIPAKEFDLRKLNLNTHIYLSGHLKENYPGNIFIVNKILSLNNIKKGQLKGLKRNVICRNYGLTPSQIVSLGKFKEGADSEYLIACRVGARNIPVILDTVRL